MGLGLASARAAVGLVEMLGQMPGKAAVLAITGLQLLWALL